MMIEQFRQCGYKAEAVELTAEELVAAQYGTVWTDPVIVEESESAERRPARATFAPLQRVGGAYSGKFSGTFEPRPSGTDNTEPDWLQLLSAAGFSVTGDVATWAAESVASGVVGKSVTIKTRDGAYERTLAGARVSKLTFSAESGTTWKCEMEAVGRYSDAVQTAFLAAAHPSAGLAPVFLGTAVTIGGANAPVSSVEISVENTVTPSKDGTHASGYGRNVITESKAFFRATVQEDGTTNWRDKARNDAAGDLLAITVVMGSGAAGYTQTWTGTITLSKQPVVTYVEGIGYWQVEGEFMTASSAAALTYTQS